MEHLTVDPRVKMQMNSCLICNETFVAKTILTQEDGKTVFDNICGILQIPEPDSEGYVPETNPLCVSCVGITEAFYSLQFKIKKLISALGKLREILALKAVNSYSATPTDRKNYETKKHIHDVWLSKVPQDQTLYPQNQFSELTQTVVQIIQNSADVDDDGESLSINSPSPPDSPINDFDDDFNNNCDDNETASVQQNNDTTFENQAAASADSVLPDIPNALENQNEQQQDISGVVDNSVNIIKADATTTKRRSINGRTGADGAGSSVKLRRGNHQCRFCGHLFATNFALEMHVRIHTGEKPFECSICSRKFSAKAARDNHEKTHDPSRRKGEPKYQCDLCDRKYHLLCSFRSHMLRHKKGLKFRAKPVPGVKKVYPRNKPTPCPICGKILTRVDKLKPHLKLHEQNKIPKELTAPPTKRSGFRKWTQGKKREKNVDAENGSSSPKAKAGRAKKARQLGRRALSLARSKECTECGKKFANGFQLKLHSRIHTGETPYECTICHRRFARPENRIKHMKIHDPCQGEKEKICDICGKGFYLQQALYKHRRYVHMGVIPSDVRPATCPICGIVLRRANKLKAHMARHSEAEKIHKCTVCGKPFHTQSEANHHAANLHNPERFYRLLFKHKCPECPPESLGFRNKGEMKHHWLECHKDKPMPAVYLKSKFNHSNTTGRFECPHCPETKRSVYWQRISLLRHIRRHHRDQVQTRIKKEKGSVRKRRNAGKRKTETDDDDEEECSNSGSSDDEEELNLDDDDDESDIDKSEDETPKIVKQSARLRNKKSATLTKSKKTTAKSGDSAGTSRGNVCLGNKDVKIMLTRLEDDDDICEKYDVLEKLDKLPIIKTEIIIYNL